MFTVLKRDTEDEEKRGKETIHSGHFMVSQFEAEGEDDEYELAVPIPDSDPNDYKEIPAGIAEKDVVSKTMQTQQPLTIDTSLAKLLQCMSIAYRFVLSFLIWIIFAILLF